MKLDTRLVRQVNDYAFDEATRLNGVEVLMALFEIFEVPYDPDVLRGRDRSRSVHTDDVRAILTAVYYEQARQDDRELHDDVVEEFERLIESLAPTGD